MWIATVIDYQDGRVRAMRIQGATVTEAAMAADECHKETESIISLVNVD